MTLKEILKHNKEFVKQLNNSFSYPATPKKSLAILTCMDHRLIDFLEPALGIKRGEAVIIKNAGNTIVEKERDILRSLIIALYLLECKEIAVIGHTKCGMEKTDLDKLKDTFLANGINPNIFKDLEFDKWVGTFENSRENVIHTVTTIRKSPLIAKKFPIHGLIIDLASGKLDHLITL